MSTLDTSLLVAAIAPEEDAAAMEQIDGERHLIMSPVVVFEAVAALRRMRGVPVADATTIVQEFLARAGVSVEVLASDIYLEALHAWEVYGKVPGIPPGSTWGIASLTRWRKEKAAACSTRGTTSPKPISADGIRNQRRPSASRPAPAKSSARPLDAVRR